MKKHSILIVEDEMLVRGGLKAMIGWDKLDIEVCGDAENGAEALKIYEKFHPDIILTDIRMPVMDGLEMISIIREKDSKAKIIFLTCYEEFSYLRDAMKLGVSDYILKLKMKPDEIEQVLEKICRQLDQEQKNPEYDAAKNATIKEDLFRDYIFYRKTTAENMRGWEKKLDFQIKEKNLVMCRLVFLNYDQVKERVKDMQGALTRFLVTNMVTEIAGSLGSVELVWESEGKLLLLVNTDASGEDGMAELRSVLWKISRSLDEAMGAKCSWKSSSVQDSWEALPQQYQECLAQMEKTGRKEDRRQDAFYRNEAVPEEKEATGEVSVEVYKAMQYIEEHLSEKLTLNQVADYIALSPNYLSSLWKKELRIGFVDYITEKRIEKALELFETTDLRMHEVAEQTGFVDDSYFSKTFKRVTGKRPSTFRKRKLEH